MIKINNKESVKIFDQPQTHIPEQNNRSACREKNARICSTTVRSPNIWKCCLSLATSAYSHPHFLWPHSPRYWATFWNCEGMPSSSASSFSGPLAVEYRTSEPGRYECAKFAFLRCTTTKLQLKRNGREKVSRSRAFNIVRKL